MLLPRRPRLGILGGQGALASAEFHRRFVRRWASMPGIVTDSDYPDVLHWSSPLPGLDSRGLQDPTVAWHALHGRLTLMEGWGADVVALPCNSLHPTLPDLRSAFQRPLLSPWEVALPVLAAPGLSLVVLGSQSLRGALTEDSRLSSLPLTCEEAQTVDLVIDAVLRGDLRTASGALSELLSRLGRRHAQGQLHVALACTELSVAYCAGPMPHFVEVTDTLDVLVDACIDELTSLCQAT